MSRNSAIRLLVLCSLAAGLWAQQSTPQYSVAGVVINSKTGEVIKRAEVVLRSYPSSGPPSASTLSTFTDSAGTFRFSVVPAGNCFLTVRKPQFAQARSGGVTLQLNASVENVQLSLMPLGAIWGKVLDQEGLPLRNVNIIALSLATIDGVRQTKSERNVATDDRGMYRLWNFEPGKYYVKAAGKSGGTHVYAGDTSPVYFTAEEAFAPTYFGGAHTLETAQAIQIEAGIEARADLNLTMLPAYKIRGSIGNFVPHRSVKFELLSGDEDVSASRVSVNGDTGTFEIQDVFPGSYTVRAIQDSASAETPITVGQANIAGLSLQLSSAVDIQVHQELTNPAKETRERALLGGRPLDAACNVSLRPPGRRAGPKYSVARQRAAWSPADGAKLSQVLPGSYRAVIECVGGYAKSAMFAVQDLLANPFLTIQPGGAPPSIEIVTTRGGGTIEGKITMDAGKEARFAILLVPQFSPTTGPISYETVGGRDNFYFAGLAPGSYTAYAFSSTEEVEFRSPAFIQSLHGGVTVKVEDNQTSAVEIKEFVR
jgi:hypothetical protein